MFLLEWFDEKHSDRDEPRRRDPARQTPPCAWPQSGRPAHRGNHVRRSSAPARGDAARGDLQREAHSRVRRG